MKPSFFLKYLSLALVVMALGASPPAFADGSAKADAARTIEIKEYNYTPNTLKVHVGETVTWINRDQVPHTIVEKNILFRSSALDTDDKYSYTFKKPGTYAYFCSLHPQMTGTVTVEP